MIKIINKELSNSFPKEAKKKEFYQDKCHVLSNASTMLVYIIAPLENEEQFCRST